MPPTNPKKKSMNWLFAFNKTNYAKGLWAECVAACYLLFKGYALLQWRYKTKLGEIDWIASKGSVLVMVEVKNRQGLEDALQALTPQMQKRIEQAAKLYMTRRGHRPLKKGQDTIVRFDLIAVSGFKISHLENIWLCRTS
jgi:putative endonuclease